MCGRCRLSYMCSYLTSPEIESLIISILQTRKWARKVTLGVQVCSRVSRTRSQTPKSLLVMPCCTSCLSRNQWSKVTYRLQVTVS